MGIFFLICTANKWDSPLARLLTVLFVQYTLLVNFGMSLEEYKH